MRCVFVGTGGFLGRIDGETRCAFWAEEPVDHCFDPQRLITVDLARTPLAAAACETAVSPGGKRTLRLLARTLRLPVFGAGKPLMRSHYDGLGFDPAFARVLVEASEIV